MTRRSAMQDFEATRTNTGVNGKMRHSGLGAVARMFSALIACVVLLQPAIASGAPPAPGETGEGATDWPAVTLRRMPGEYQAPVHLTHAGDGSGRLFVVEKRGVVRIIQRGQTLAQPFLDISDRVNSECPECGLFSIAFPTDYATSGYFFASYTAKEDLADPEPTDKDNDSGNDSVIARFRLSSDPNRADAASEEPILIRNQPFRNHNGGQIAFGPDGYLYFGLGDGGQGGDPLNSGQSTDTLLGKMLRLEVGASGAYTVPVSNPFKDSTEYLPEIWATGLRNPWRFSFDRLTGDLYIADVGQGEHEEISFQPSTSTGGENYGWNVMEGAHCYEADTCDQTGLTLPVHEYGRQPGNCASVTGGFVYRGPYSNWQGVYFFADYCTGIISGLRRTSNTWLPNDLLNTEISITSFGEDEAGELYVVGIESNDQASAGVVYQLTRPYALYLPSLTNSAPGESATRP